MKHPRLLTLALALSTGIAFAQPPANNNGGGQNQAPQNNQNPNGQNDKPPRDGKGHPKSPLLEALDTNGDGIISADEIANAPESLKKLDKNGDGKITPDELRPPRPKDGPPQDNKNGDGPKKRPRPEGQQGQQQAQNNTPPPAPDGQKDPSGQNGPGKDAGPTDRQGHRPPPSPLMAALDTDKDGTLSAEEIANASASLKTLDKNGDGQLTPDEYRPAPRDRDKGPQDGNKGPRNGDTNQPQPPKDNNDASPKKRPPTE